MRMKYKYYEKAGRLLCQAERKIRLSDVKHYGGQGQNDNITALLFVDIYYGSLKIVYEIEGRT